MATQAMDGYQLIPTGSKNSFLPTGTSCKDNQYENDQLFEVLSDLVNPEFRAWYCKAFYKLGKTRVLELAAIARADGKQPRKLFSKLIKKEVI